MSGCGGLGLVSGFRGGRASVVRLVVFLVFAVLATLTAPVVVASAQSVPDCGLDVAPPVGGADFDAVEGEVYSLEAGNGLFLAGSGLPQTMTRDTISPGLFHQFFGARSVDTSRTIFAIF